MTTEDTTTTTTTIPVDGATVDEGAVRGGTQYEVEVDPGSCYLDAATGQGTTEFGFLPCDASYPGEVIVIGEAVAVPPVPTITALPETGSEPVMLGIGAILLLMGIGVRRLARR